jgi:hypothetical protein
VEICGYGGGNVYARADNVGDTVRVVCPVGGVISEIVWARFGRLEGSCGDEGALIVRDGCEADAQKVKKRVTSVCVGAASCNITATDTEVLGESFLCEDERTSCIDADDVTRRRQQQHQHERSKEGDRHVRELTRPQPYPGTEDYYFRATTVREATAPFLRHHEPKSYSRAKEQPLVDSCEVQPTPAPKKALLIKALCRGSPFLPPLPPSLVLHVLTCVMCAVWAPSPCAHRRQGIVQVPRPGAA